MYVSIFTIYEFRIDSRALYEELRPYKMNVTDVIKTVLVYGRIEASYYRKFFSFYSNMEMQKSLSTSKPSSEGFFLSFSFSFGLTDTTTHFNSFRIYIYL